MTTPSTAVSTPMTTPAPFRSSPGRGFPGFRGFTLIEMLIVIFIILALGGIVLYNFMGTQESAERDIERIQIQGFGDALDQFRLAMSRYPSTDEGLAVLWDKTRLEDEADAAKWRLFMEEAKPRDRWGNEWIYRNPSELLEGAPYDIISPGPDKQEGTEDDISNHDGKSTEEGDGGVNTGDDGAAGGGAAGAGG